MINWTVGSGGTYSTWAAALAALPATLGDDYTLTQISDTAETVSSTGYSVNLNTHTLLLDNGSPHGGDPTVGWKSTFTSGTTNGSLIRIHASGTGQLEIKNLNLRLAGAGSGLTAIRLQAQDAHTELVHDCIVDATGSPNAVGYRIDENASTVTLTTWHLWNLVGSNCSSKGFMSSFSSYNPASAVLENSTFFDCDDGLDCGGLVNLTLRNVVSINNVDTDFSNINFNVTGYNCASEDTSANQFSAGSGNVTGLTPANEMESFSISSSDYAKCKAGGTCEDGGTTPAIAGNTAGIRGNARPHGSDVSIGADEFPAAGPGGGGGSGSGGGGISGAITAAMAAGY